MKQNKHLVIVIESLGGGGAQKAAINLAKQWCEEGFIASFILFSQKSEICFPPPSEVKIHFLEKCPSPDARGVRTNLRRIFSLRKMLKSLNPDIVLTMVSTTNTIGCLASIGMKWRLVISERNDPTRQKIGRFWQIARTLSYPFADLITANSEVALKFLAKRHKKEKLLYVPNIVVTSSADAISRTTNISRLKILSVGRLHRQKRYDVLLSALYIVRKTTTNFHLTVLGDGPLAPELKEQSITLGLEEHITWQGFQSKTEEFYKKNHVFVLASDYEGSSNALLEAMAFGLAPVISDSQEGSLQYVKNEESGSIFQQGDANSLAEHLLNYYRNPLRLRQHREKALQTSVSFDKTNAFQIWKSALTGEMPS